MIDFEGNVLPGGNPQPPRPRPEGPGPEPEQLPQPMDLDSDEELASGGSCSLYPEESDSSDESDPERFLARYYP